MLKPNSSTYVGPILTKKKSTYAKPRDNPNGVLSNLKMALSEAHVHLNSSVYVDLLSFLPPTQKATDLAWLIWRPYVMLKRSSSCVNQIMPFQDASNVKLMSYAYWAIFAFYLTWANKCP